uniref:Uncharacterized protein n=1 Tax=Plectus sambesii TaxID=2011161 RepID=A0A914VZF6_9BILA
MNRRQELQTRTTRRGWHANVTAASTQERRHVSRGCKDGPLQGRKKAPRRASIQATLLEIRLFGHEQATLGGRMGPGACPDQRLTTARRGGFDKHNADTSERRKETTHSLGFISQCHRPFYYGFLTTPALG